MKRVKDGKKEGLYRNDIAIIERIDEDGDIALRGPKGLIVGGIDNWIPFRKDELVVYIPEDVDLEIDDYIAKIREKRAKKKSKKIENKVEKSKKVLKKNNSKENIKYYLDLTNIVNTDNENINKNNIIEKIVELKKKVKKSKKIVLKMDNAQNKNVEMNNSKKSCTKVSDTRCTPHKGPMHEDCMLSDKNRCIHKKKNSKKNSKKNLKKNSKKNSKNNLVIKKISDYHPFTIKNWKDEIIIDEIVDAIAQKINIVSSGDKEDLKNKNRDIIDSIIKSWIENRQLFINSYDDSFFDENRHAGIEDDINGLFLDEFDKFGLKHHLEMQDDEWIDWNDNVRELENILRNDAKWAKNIMKL